MRRILAVIVDYALIIGLLVSLQSQWDGHGLVNFIIFTSYFALSEYLQSCTIGKWLFGLRVFYRNVGLSLLAQCYLRGTLKICYIFYPIAIIDGLYTYLGRHGRSLLDQAVHSEVFTRSGRVAHPESRSVRLLCAAVVLAPPVLMTVSVLILMALVMLFSSGNFPELFCRQSSE